MEKKPNSPVMILGGLASSIGLYSASLWVPPKFCIWTTMPKDLKLRKI
ncbi:hypothetical protein LEP1GSC166_4101 [Leptospira kirschneri]|nr:hypothetical protein LEP1GSC198_2321 [Leptospira kirschneri str. JB]EMK10096.1 hypothetical protein LEP1GSC166_4101 [Leptospira kirschneri]